VSVIAFAGVKHSPGVSTLATAVATIAAGLVVEADPAGGDLAVRAGLPVEPGLASLAVAARSTLAAPMLAAQSQQLRSGIRLLAGPLNPRLAASTIRALAEPLAVLLAEDRVVLSAVDVGRLDDPALVGPLLEAAHHRVLVMRATAEDVTGARGRLDDLAEFGTVTVAVVDRGPYPVAEIAAVLDAPVHTIAWDGRAAALLTAGQPITGWLARSPLLRTARHLHDVLASSREQVA
jgi:hypothetical protein